MIQGMRFRDGSGFVEFSEMFDDATILIIVKTVSEQYQMTADERSLREMRKWLTVQIRKIAALKKKKPTTAK